MPTEPISACQPEMAPQAMVTKSIGHSGCQETPAWIVKPRSLIGRQREAPIRLPAASFVPRMGATAIPSADKTIVIDVIQKPM